eukprot:86494-Chlamydomonas_euryale.AAC.1
MSGCDAAVASETGSGKTLSFLAPTIARLNYPPDLYPGDLKGPQAIIVVPTMELGVQVWEYKCGNVGMGSAGVGARREPCHEKRVASGARMPAIHANGGASGAVGCSPAHTLVHTACLQASQQLNASHTYASQPHTY